MSARIDALKRMYSGMTAAAKELSRSSLKKSYGLKQEPPEEMVSAEEPCPECGKGGGQCSCGDSAMAEMAEGE